MTEIQQVYKQLIQSHVSRPLSVHEGLLWMLLLHTHRIRCRVPLLTGFPDPYLLPPATQRLAAEVVATLWDGTKTNELGDYRYWYREYTLAYPKNEIMSANRLQLVELRDRLLQNQEIESVIPET